ncbi:hypothetical protein [Streptomyces sp. NPDC018833]|uniref:hypothetical protein n=1 Tax=Streptomyces sp. NPDC018833 TaxID=3365053 RepID=UPI003799E995
MATEERPHEPAGGEVPARPGADDAWCGAPVNERLLAAPRGAPAAAHRRPDVSGIGVEVDATGSLAEGVPWARLRVTDDGLREDGGRHTALTWWSPR